MSFKLLDDRVTCEFKIAKTEDFSIVGTYNLKLKAYFSTQPTVVTEAFYTITVVNPCLNPTVVFPSTIPANGYSMTLTDTLSQTFDFSSTLTLSPTFCTNTAELVNS